MKNIKFLLLIIATIAAAWIIGVYVVPSPDHTTDGTKSTGTTLQGDSSNSPEMTNIKQTEAEGISSTPGDKTDQNAPVSESEAPAIEVSAEPESITVLINKHIQLPENYKPDDLVYPNIPFIFDEMVEKRMMRKEAADALEELVTAAKKDNINLAGVSAFRSQTRQSTLFNAYVSRDGEEKAKQYSALPGHSEHQTGLAIDLSGSDGKCAAERCFAGTPEADWLAEHCAEYGFILRYPKGKEAITGYMYEPWHIRYVGSPLASTITAQGLTLEENYNVIPVSK